VGGGILLFLLAIEMVFARPSGARSMTPGEDAEAHHRADIAVFPLAFPLIAGPGALATILLAFVGVPWVRCSLRRSHHPAVPPRRLMLMTAPSASGRRLVAPCWPVLGVLLAALAAQFVMDGIRGAMGA
jgi:multiple antibiotic resistance protein